MKKVRTEKRGAHIKALRLRLGITQEVFALALGVSRPFLCHCETGRRNLTKEALQKFSRLVMEMNSKEMLAPAPVSLPPGYLQQRQEMAILESQTDVARHATLASETEVKLLEMTSLHNQLLEQIGQVERLLASYQNKEDNFFSPQFLQLHKEVLMTKLQECDDFAQSRLRHKISLALSARHLAESNIVYLKKNGNPGEE